MSSASKIEWTDATWQPITGCTILSPGCTNCYAMKLAGGRLRNLKSRKGLTTASKSGAVWNGQVRFNAEWLTQPLIWRKPKMVFVCAHGDLFHESVPDEWIDKVFAVMALTPQHTYQVLTKRAERMREYLQGNVWGRIYKAAVALAPDHERNAHLGYLLAGLGTEPRVIPNCWLGVSTERQKEADERIPHLLQTPAAVRFISAEPLLGPLDLWNGDPDPRLGGHEATHTFLGDWWEPGDDPKGPSRHGVDWVIAGGESGPGARPSHPDWFRSLRDQCAAAEVPFFFKQWGAYKPNFPQYGSEFGVEDDDDWMCSGRDFPDEGVLYRSGHFYDGVEYQPHVGEGAYWVERVGKKAAGRLLDNRTHDDMPGRG